MLTRIEETRVALSQATDRRRKSQLGQFFTPTSVAQFMAGLFVQNELRQCRLLDPGAGIGSLSAAFLERCGSIAERFIQVPTSSPGISEGNDSADWYTLDQLGISVSTGPIVDFRLQDHLRDSPESETVPLLYPGHVRGWYVDWPRHDGKKPNAILCNDETRKWLYPNGYYCVVRRFSSKEERRRIVASVIAPDDFPGFRLVGLENHLNVFHSGRKGLPDALAHGLTVYLNSTVVDEDFRRFNGHTQVNATDLRRMKYPSKKALIDLGKWAMQRAQHSQDEIDEQLRGRRLADGKQGARNRFHALVAGSATRATQRKIGALFACAAQPGT